MIRFILLSFIFIHCQSKVLEVEGLKINTHDNHAYLSGQNLKEVPSNINLQDIGELIKSSYWVSPLTNKNLQLDHSKVPEANLLVVSYGATAENEETLGSKTSVDYNFFPADSVSLLTTLSTSVEPKHHGIVGAKWYKQGELTSAYTDGETTTFSSVPSFVDSIKNAHKDSVDIVTASHCNKLAKSIAQNNEVHTVNEKNEYTTGSEPLFSLEDLKTELKNNEFWKQFNTEDIKTNFLMDIEYIRRLSEDMQKSSDKSTLYNIAVYVPDNEVAQKIFSKALTKIRSAFDRIYPEGSSQVVFLNEPTVEEVGPEPAAYQPKVFSSKCGDSYSGTTTGYCTNENAIIQDSRSYQISTWSAWMGFFFLYMFCMEFAYMSYDNDSVLFSRYKRGNMSQSMGMGGPSTGAFNISNNRDF